MNLESDLIDPNISHLPFYMPETYKTARYKITKLPLRERLDPGTGTVFDETPAKGFRFRSGPEVVHTPTDEYSPYLEFYSKYAYFWLAKGLASVNRSDLESAHQQFSKALLKVPYCIPALYNLCILQERVMGDASECWQDLLLLKGHFYDYYSLKGQ
jgi:hypothetical protein